MLELWSDYLYVKTRVREYWPKCFQSTVWAFQSSGQHRHSWILQVIVTQVQVFQVAELRAEYWGQICTASLRQVAETEPEEDEVMTVLFFLRVVCLNFITIRLDCDILAMFLYIMPNTIKTNIEVDRPESFEPRVWTLQSSREQLQSWILQVVVTQVKFSQTMILFHIWTACCY